jgi:hypothetical protein
MTRLAVILSLCITCSAQVPPFPLLPTNRVAKPQPQAVTLIWNPSTDPSVTGYNVYYGVASRTYTNKLDAGSATNVTVKGLIRGSTYFFAATAYNLLGVESDYSSEVSYAVPLPRPKTNRVVKVWVPILSGRNVEGPWTATNALAICLTNPPADMQFWKGHGLTIQVEWF